MHRLDQAANNMAARADQWNRFVTDGPRRRGPFSAAATRLVPTRCADGHGSRLTLQAVVDGLDMARVSAIITLLFRIFSSGFLQFLDDNVFHRLDERDDDG